MTWQVKKLTWLNEEELRRDSDGLGSFAFTTHRKEKYKSEEQWTRRAMLECCCRLTP